MSGVEKRGEGEICVKRQLNEHVCAYTAVLWITVISKMSSKSNIFSNLVQTHTHIQTHINYNFSDNHFASDTAKFPPSALWLCSSLFPHFPLLLYVYLCLSVLPSHTCRAQKHTTPALSWGWWLSPLCTQPLSGASNANNNLMNIHDWSKERRKHRKWEAGEGKGDWEGLKVGETGKWKKRHKIRVDPSFSNWRVVLKMALRCALRGHLHGFPYKQQYVFMRLYPRKHFFLVHWLKNKFTTPDLD